MIPSDLASQLRALTESTVLSLAAVPEIPSELPDFESGQRFSAQIQNPLPDGTFRALVAGRTITLALPDSAKSGDVLELVVTGNKDGTIYAQIAPAASDNNPKPQLSQAGQLISQLLTGRFGEPEPVDLAQGKPLVPQPPSPTATTTAAGSQTTTQPNAQSGAQISARAGAQLNALASSTSAPISPLANALRQAVSASGLFFEAHQAQWMDGDKTLQSLLSEPQAREGQRQAASQNAQADMTSSSSQVRTTLLANGDTNLSKSAQTTSQPATDGAVRQSALATAKAGEDTTVASKNAFRIPDNLMPLVHQQLEALATHHIAWQGQVWPGQYMQWDVHDPNDEHATGNSDTPPEWKSTLRLTLPRLGGVEANLVLTSAGLALKLNADDTRTADRMRAAEQQLHDALEAAGVPLTGMAVIHHANA
ncbi:MAG TPA: flagellar hook-length control protein FliK [Rhodocyclaceae bacterium]|nr:flagellar hook-length control protein FliK [Rhodocyclaceae bacterium]